MLLQTRGTQLRARVAVQLVTGMGGKDICVHVSCVCLGVGRGLRRGWREGGESGGLQSMGLLRVGHD